MKMKTLAHKMLTSIKTINKDDWDDGQQKFSSFKRKFSFQFSTRSFSSYHDCLNNSIYGHVLLFGYQFYVFKIIINCFPIKVFDQKRYSNIFKVCFIYLLPKDLYIGCLVSRRTFQRSNKTKNTTLL
jgi:hypothetical protein